MRQTWNKIIQSLNTGILGLSRFTFGKGVFAIILLAIMTGLLAIPSKIRLARQSKENAAKMEAVRSERDAIEEKYQSEPGQLASFETTRQKGEELKRLYQRNYFNFSPGSMFFLNSLASMVIAQAIGGIKKDERFQEGGILWFKDLTKPDRFLVLPALLTAIQVARHFVVPNRFNQEPANRLLGFERVERLANFTRFIPVAYFILPVILNKRPSAAESIFAVTQEGVSLVEDYLIRMMITDKEETVF